MFEFPPLFKSGRRFCFFLAETVSPGELLFCFRNYFSFHSFILHSINLKEDCGKHFPLRLYPGFIFFSSLPSSPRPFSSFLFSTCYSFYLHPSCLILPFLKLSSPPIISSLFFSSPQSLSICIAKGPGSSSKPFSCCSLAQLSRAPCCGGSPCFFSSSHPTSIPLFTSHWHSDHFLYQELEGTPLSSSPPSFSCSCQNFYVHCLKKRCCFCNATQAFKLCWHFFYSLLPRPSMLSLQFH